MNPVATGRKDGIRIVTAVALGVLLLNNNLKIHQNLNKDVVLLDIMLEGILRRIRNTFTKRIEI